MHLSSGSADRLLEALDPEQREVAVALQGPVRVLAGAGTGKTRAITHRMAYGVASGAYNPREVLAVTFTTRAAGEMRGRLRALGAEGVQARTFHSAALRQARYFWPRVYGGELPVLTESKLALLGNAARRNRVQTDQATLRDLASEVEWAKVSNVRPDDYPRLAEQRGRSVTGIDAATVARVFATYEDVKRDQGRMDMEDVLLCAAALLAEDERVAAEVRRQYKHFVVDEFQDVSPVQSALLDLWLGGRSDLCVVGDPAQTIYSFAGANASFLLDFPKRFAGTTSIELVRNYRSTPQVIVAANRLLAGSSSAGVQLRAQREAGPEVAYSERPDEVDEAEHVAAQVLELTQAGTPLREIAVLFRINAQSEAFEEALAARNLPYVVRGAARFFERAEVRQAVTLLRGSARSGAGDGDGDGLVGSVRAVLAGMGWSDQPPTGRGNVRDRWESLHALVSQAEELARTTPEADLTQFVAELDRRAAEQHAPVAEGVTLATLHTAKGLEWDAVFLAGMQDGTLPIVYAEGADAVEEERRLLYVGMTRARVHLKISWSRARNPGARAIRKPSRFLTGLRPEVGSDQSDGDRAAKRRRGVANCRTCGRPLGSTAERKVGRCEDCPAAYDEELFERLRAWRVERATQEKVPAYVVFTDLTLQAIAETRPTDTAGLLRVNGVGQAKLTKYGDDVLALLGDAS
ncbi:ATP-dependent DNA helicase UvrD2 [Nocardioides mesophilus]|uniref:DNA 3'-5' helicase n=1 Tax=Nocardioides mesophilus TaxID=433659 RepID=A0A7G9R846_9ACTN|nr:ATP-dependent DNA helicase UvrD2 [Nocardioides mesophilus]QNN51771.1 ATP-dependent DNA helicase UvrD2 [Nocardioides mesophilus]